KAREEIAQQYVIFAVWSSGYSNPQNTYDDAAFGGKEPEFEGRKPESAVHDSPSSKFEDLSDNSINEVNSSSSLVPAVGQISTNSTNTFSFAGPSNADRLTLPILETSITVSPIPTTRVHQDHPVTQIIGSLSSATQTRSMTRVAKDQGGLSQINNDDFHTCMFSCFLSQEEPKRKVWVLVDLPNGKRAIGHTQDEGINYEEVFAPVAKIEAIRLFLAYASFMGFMVYQMNVKSAFLYETIEEEVYVCQPLGFEDPDHPDKVYKVVKIYVDDIIFDGKSASTPIDNKKPLLKDLDGEDVDVHTYRSMISSLMYLTSSRPDIMFATNDVVRLQALIDRKKVLITEDTVRQDLHLDDAERINCLPDEEIVAELQGWGRKFIFLKYIFDSLVRNVDSSSKFYMYPRFLQLMLSAQVGDLSSHTTKYTSPALIQKVFANMRRVRKGFFGVDTPLFKGMLMPQQVADDVADVVVDEVVDDVVAKDFVEPTPPSPTPTTPPPPQQEVTSTPPPSPHQSLIAPPLSPPSLQQPLHNAAIFMDLLNTLLETCTSLIRKVEALEQDKIAQALEITKLKQRARRLEKKKLKLYGRMHLNMGIIELIDADEDVILEEADAAKDDKVTKDADLITEVVIAAATTAGSTITAAPSATRRRKRVVIRDPEETATPSTIVHSEIKSKDKGKGILVEEPKPLKKQAQIEQDKSYTRELEAELNKNIN
nr:hypothetical protein [Tanacetum cinerariifolium]